MKTVNTYPLPGETYFQTRPNRKLASETAEKHYDVESLDAVSDQHSGQAWAVRTRGGYAAMIGYLDTEHGNCLAILHKNPDGSCTLESYPEVKPL